MAMIHDTSFVYTEPSLLPRYYGGGRQSSRYCDSLEYCQSQLIYVFAIMFIYYKIPLQYWRLAESAPALSWSRDKITHVETSLVSKGHPFD